MRKPLLLILLLGSIVSYSNETTTYAPREYSIMPASPNVSSLIKYNDISVNHFNGLPDISFPLYTIQEDLNNQMCADEISIFSSSGALMWQKTNSAIESAGTIECPTAELVPGDYLLTCLIGEKRYSFKIVKK